MILVFVFLGWKFIQADNYVPYIPENTGKLGEFGWSGILRGAAIVFFAFLGFDAVSTAAQETKNPKRDMPIGILVSLLVCTILYILFAHVMTGVAHYTDFKGQEGIAPVAVAIEQMGYANDKQIPFVAIVGENEMNEGKLTLKNMTTGEQSLVTPDELLAVVKA